VSVASSSVLTEAELGRHAAARHPLIRDALAQGVDLWKSAADGS
jgi:hypothetical protein